MNVEYAEYDHGWLTFDCWRSTVREEEDYDDDAPILPIRDAPDPKPPYALPGDRLS